MKLWIALLAACLTSCHPPANLDTSAWADAGTCVFENRCKPDTMKHFDALLKLQESIIPSNLTIRHHLALGDTATAIKQAEYLTVNGYWAEGISYYKYSKVAFDWAHIPMPQSGTMDFHYAVISGPDSTIPLPECRLTDRVPPQGQAYYRDSSFTVYRGKDYFILIGTQTDLSRAKNLHVHGPSYAYWKGGVWIARPKPYEGFDVSKVLEDEAEWNTVPYGIFVGSWRLNPPKIKVVRWGHDSTIISYGKKKRMFIVNGSDLKVIDE